MIIISKNQFCTVHERYGGDWVCLKNPISDARYISDLKGEKSRGLMKMTKNKIKTLFKGKSFRHVLG